MSMSHKQFVELVKQSELAVKDNPDGYQSKLLMFAVFGYVVICLVLLSVLGLFGGIIWIALISSTTAILLLKKLIIPVGFLAFLLIRSLCVRFEAPEGYELKRKEFPKLFEVIDQLREPLDALPVHQVLLNPDFNASVVQTPRLGVFGWQRNTLTLGLELLLILSPEEAKAVLAHEFGHLSKNHSRFAGWIYRVRITWEQVMETFDASNGFGQGILKRFFDWYVPRFSAYSFALARSNEYEADAIAAELTSPETASQALVRVHVAAPYVEEHYWKHFFRKADTVPQPVDPPYQKMSSFLSENKQANKDIKHCFEKEMKLETEYHDTHPSLRDRLKAIGPRSIPFSKNKVSAAEAWLGKNFAKIIKNFDADWKRSNSEGWRQRYDYATQSVKTLREMESRSNESLSDDELWDKARLTREFCPDKDPISLFQEYQKRHPNDRDVSFVIGDILSEKNDEACIGHFKEAAKEMRLRFRACEEAYAFFKQAGRKKEADLWYERAVKQMEIDQLADAEREECSPGDSYKKPAMSENHKQRLVELLSLHPKVASAWLAEKKVRYYSKENPVYVVAFKSKGYFYNREKVMESVAESLDIPLDISVVVKGGDYAKLARKIIKVGEKIL